MNKVPLIYLDNCCFNRPFDDQSQLKIHLETEAKLAIQAKIVSGDFKLIWSFVLKYENQRNPYADRRRKTTNWISYASVLVVPDQAIFDKAEELMRSNLKPMDALHLACAVSAVADFFITTDMGILRKGQSCKGALRIISPLEFWEEDVS